MTWWEYRMDRIAEGTRWRSSSAGLIQTHDAVGDALIMELREAARAAEDDRNISRWSFDLLQRFVDYDDERRLLVKLADTGRILQLLQRAIETTLGVLGICEETTATTWREHLQHERERRVAFYEASIVDERRMTIEMGDETQQIEVLTLMKHGLEKFGEVLTPSELDEISAGFDIVSRRSGFAVGRIPVWFATSRGDWTDARKSSVGGGGEETCLREVAIWKQLHHPHVRKFYGACHVGKPFFIHDAYLYMAKRFFIEDWFERGLIAGMPTWRFFWAVHLGWCTFMSAASCISAYRRERS